MIHSDKLNTKDLLKHMKYLMPQYLENLPKPVEDESESQLSIFIENELLIRYFFSTTYANEHLDYDLFCIAIEGIIGIGKVHDPAKAVQELSDFVDRSATQYQWIAVIPMRFDSIAEIFDPSTIRETQTFGRFSLLKPAADLNEFQAALDKLYGGMAPLEDAYGHQITQGLKKTQVFPFLSFEVRGAPDARNSSTKRKLSYFCSLAEVFCVTGKAIGTQHDGQKIEKAFFPNVQTGKIDRLPLDRKTSLKIDMSDDLLDFMHNNDFGCFADMIFTTEDSLFARLRSALFFFSKGFNGEDRVLSFICYVVAIEALFTGVVRNRIAENLSICISHLCYAEPDRSQIEANVKEIYKQRSAIMHHGRFDLSNGKVDQARELAAAAIFNTFKLHKSLRDQVTCDLEKEDMAQRFTAHVSKWLSDNQDSSPTRLQETAR